MASISLSQEHSPQAAQMLGKDDDDEPVPLRNEPIIRGVRCKLSTTVPGTRVDQLWQLTGIGKRCESEGGTQGT